MRETLVSIGSIGVMTAAQPVQAVSAQRVNIGVATEWPDEVKRLTPGDKDLIASMYGPDVLTTGYDASGKAVGTPPFVQQLIDARRSGWIPSGSEVSSSWLNELNSMYTNAPKAAGSNLSNPLTPELLDKALKYLASRVQGSVIDVQA